MPREQVTMKTITRIAAAAVCIFIAYCSEKGSEQSIVSVKTCGMCHGLPPSDTNHAFYFVSAANRNIMCSACHPGYAADSSSNNFYVNSVTHMDGKAQASYKPSAATCNLCHGLPPKDVAHAYHHDTLQNECSICHVGYRADSVYAVNSATHLNGLPDVVFSSTYNNNGLASYDAGLKQCSNVYCHGGFPQGTMDTIAWTRGPDSTDGTCATCHNLTLVYKKHYGHTRLGQSGVSGKNVQLCYNCHSPSDTIGRKINPLTHFDPGMKTGSCGQCHATENPGWTTWEEYVASHPGVTPLAKMQD
jgi:predicted CxxxxCH...CXXCH cytochrome family protein